MYWWYILCWYRSIKLNGHTFLPFDLINISSRVVSWREKHANTVWITNNDLAPCTYAYTCMCTYIYVYIVVFIYITYICLYESKRERKGTYVYVPGNRDNS